MNSDKPTQKHTSRIAASATNQVMVYDVIDKYIAEIYDQQETQCDDVNLLLSLIGSRQCKILEPFCGHGRILIPLAQAGYEIVGLDLSDQLLRILAERLRQLPTEVQTRASFRKADVIADEWSRGFEVVILGCNCFYELAMPAEQERCIAAAARALNPGGHLYLDNDHMEGDLAPSWCHLGVEENAFPTGVCVDGTLIQGASETVWYDKKQRLVRFHRSVMIQTKDGDIHRREWIQQKHPPSTEEMSAWLNKYGFVTEHLWGDRQRTPYSSESTRAVFWAKKFGGT
jgi:SAM-dependent methyltransferase